MASDEAKMLAYMEDLSQRAIKLFFDKGVTMGLFKGTDYQVIMAVIEEEALAKQLEEVQKHMDDHHDRGEKCTELQYAEAIFDLETQPDGRIKVLGYKKANTAGMN